MCESVTGKPFLSLNPHRDKSKKRGERNGKEEEGFFNLYPILSPRSALLLLSIGRFLASLFRPQEERWSRVRVTHFFVAHHPWSSPSLSRIFSFVFLPTSLARTRSHPAVKLFLVTLLFLSALLSSSLKFSRGESLTNSLSRLFSSGRAVAVSR